MKRVLVGFLIRITSTSGSYTLVQSDESGKDFMYSMIYMNNSIIIIIEQTNIIKVHETFSVFISIKTSYSQLINLIQHLT